MTPADGSPPTLSAADHAAMLSYRDRLRLDLAEALTVYPAGTENRGELVAEWLYESTNCGPETPEHVWYEDAVADERMAAGHIDYADKFTLYLAQRAWGVR